MAPSAQDFIRDAVIGETPAPAGVHTAVLELDAFVASARAPIIKASPVGNEAEQKGDGNAETEG